MNNSITMGIDELFGLFEPSLDVSDIIEAKLMSETALAITKERLRLKMSQTQFAKHLGVQQSMISRWEQGDYNFTIKKIAEIAAKLNIDVNISFSNKDAANIFKHIPRNEASQINNIYFFDEFKKNKNAFKCASYTGKGWENVAVR